MGADLVSNEGSLLAILGYFDEEKIVTLPDADDVRKFDIQLHKSLGSLN